MKAYTLAMIIVLALAVLPAAAQESHEPSVEYGNYCGPYGRPMTIHEAVEALKSFFDKEGLGVRVIDHKGHFIRADVLKGDEVVDSIVLDARTGKMRSIY